MSDAGTSGTAFTRRERGLFAAAVASTHMPMIFTDASSPRQPIVFVNDAFLNLTGYVQCEIIDQPFSLIVADRGKGVEAVIASAFEAGGSDICCRRHDNSSFWATVHVSPVQNERGVTSHFFASFIDLTRRFAERDKIKALTSDIAAKSTEIRVLQSSMIQASRLSAIGMVGATMAHELNQPLTAISNYLRGARRLIDASETLPVDGVLDALNNADQSAGRASHIIRRVRDVARHRLETEQHECLQPLIEEACGLALIDATPMGIETSFNFDDANALVFVDRIEIQQVIINLVHNAMDAVADRAVRKILVSTVQRSDNLCEIAVRDSGAGIAAGAINDLFKPFKSTKFNGVGIGLAISRTIIESHGGRIWLESSTCHGAEFRFSLPVWVDDQGSVTPRQSKCG